MDEELEALVVSVRADTRAFQRDVAEMRGSLEGPFAAGAERAGRAVEASLLRAVRTGSLGFDELGKVALRVLDGIAAGAVRAGLDTLLGGGGERRAPAGGGLLGVFASLLSGVPGRATGGPVSPARPYWVGERGPELFVPTAAGRVEAPVAVGAAARGPVPTPVALPPREVRVAITVRAEAGAAPAALAQSGRQVARAVKAALARAE